MIAIAMMAIAMMMNRIIRSATPLLRRYAVVLLPALRRYAVVLLPASIIIRNQSLSRVVEQMAGPAPQGRADLIPMVRVVLRQVEGDRYETRIRRGRIKIELDVLTVRKEDSASGIMPRQQGRFRSRQLQLRQGQMSLPGAAQTRRQL